MSVRPGFVWRVLAIALGVLLGLYAAVWLDGQDNTPEAARRYHRVSVAQLATTKWTHVEVCGVVTLVKKEADGDLHIRISEGSAFIVAESVPYHPLPAPKTGQRICAQGISRFDRTHGWAEVHPVEQWTRVP